MSFAGTVVNGAVVLAEPLTVPDGTEVEIVVKEPVEAASELGAMLLRHAGKVVGLPPDAAAASNSPPTLAGLLKFAGRFTDMPADFAAEHDHYIHGTPRRTPKETE